MAIKMNKKNAVLAVPTSSMGDIAFLIIIFFMLTSKFMQESHVKYLQATSPDVEQISDSPVSIILDEEKKLWLQGQPSTPEEIKGIVEEMRGDNKDFTVMLKVDKNLQAKDYNAIIRKLAEAGVKVAFVGENGTSYEQ